MKKPVKLGAPLKENAATKNLSPIRITEEQDKKYRLAAKLTNLPLAAWVKKSLDKSAQDEINRNVTKG